jgi:Flp pilus assembly pilin Flp
MMIRMKKNRGQTMVEYALVLAVIVVGVIFAAHNIFGKKDSAAENLLKQSVEQAQKTMTLPGGGS